MSLKDVAEAAVARGMGHASQTPNETPVSPLNGHGPVPRRGRMNQQERRYSEHLELRPDVIWWVFEGIKLNVGSDEKPAWYTPDFLVQRTTGGLELHEFKGHWREAARLRIKAAARYPFRILAIKELPGVHAYDIEEIR